MFKLLYRLLKPKDDVEIPELDWDRQAQMAGAEPNEEVKQDTIAELHRRLDRLCNILQARIEADNRRVSLLTRLPPAKYADLVSAITQADDSAN